MEWALRPQRRPVLHAASCGPSVGSGRPARIAHVSRARGGLHGPHPRLPRAGGEAEGPAGRHGWIFLPQVHRSVHFWWVWMTRVCRIQGLISGAWLQSGRKFKNDYEFMTQECQNCGIKSIYPHSYDFWILWTLTDWMSSNNWTKHHNIIMHFDVPHSK